jgi:hypothetical protein
MDEAAGDDDDRHQAHPEMDDSCPSVRAPHQLLGRIEPGMGPLNRPPRRHPNGSGPPPSRNPARDPEMRKPLTGFRRIVAGVKMDYGRGFEWPPVHEVRQRRNHEGRIGPIGWGDRPRGRTDRPQQRDHRLAEAGAGPGATAGGRQSGSPAAWLSSGSDGDAVQLIRERAEALAEEEFAA